MFTVDTRRHLLSLKLWNTQKNVCTCKLMHRARKNNDLRLGLYLYFTIFYSKQSKAQPGQINYKDLPFYDHLDRYRQIKSEKEILPCLFSLSFFLCWKRSDVAIWLESIFGHGNNLFTLEKHLKGHHHCRSHENPRPSFASRQTPTTFGCQFFAKSEPATLTIKI